MKNKSYRLLSLLLAIPLVLSGCASEPDPQVTGVKITGATETEVLDGSRVSLKTTVTADEGANTKVTWSSSNPSAAAVSTAGVVTFGKVAEETSVTITATSVANPEVKDTVTYTVYHSPFDLDNSRGNPDSSCYIDDGVFTVEDPQDIALIYADVNHTRWYVEATITLTGFNSDPYPKFGIMASDRDDGMWCYELSHNIFYYVDAVNGQQSWPNMNVVRENGANDWNWGGQIGSASASPVVRYGEPFKMGLMRDGNRFYQLYGQATDVTLKCVGTFEYTEFGENANYVWIGGWGSAAEVANPKCMVGDAIDTLYTVPEALSLKSSEEGLFLGDHYQIEVSAAGLWDRQKLTYTSSDPTIATVSETGLVTASDTNTGEATITVGLEGTELSAEFKVVATDDPLYKVVLDGRMDDAIWSETVKTNRYLLKKNDTNYINIYASKNSRGVYLFYDYTVSALKTVGGGWWNWDNAEFYLADNTNAWGGQYWISVENGGSAVSVGSGEKPLEIFYKTLEQGQDSLYHGAFELFVPYGYDKCTKDQNTYFRSGFNPAAGWASSYNWDGGLNTATSLNITADGFVRGTGEEAAKCSAGGHAYGEWVIDTPNSCVADGARHKVCSICGHVHNEVIPLDPEAHDYDYEHATVTKTPTCTETGIGTATCKLCNAVQQTVLPKDYSNHVDQDYPTTHDHCEACGMGNYAKNLEANHAFGGWKDKSTWTDFGLFSGDFVFTVEFDMHGGLNDNGELITGDPGNTCWRTVLPVLYKDGYVADTNQVCQVFRMDWFGWTDHGEGFFADQNKGAFPTGFNWDINWEAFGDMSVVLTFTKRGVDISLDWVWTCNATSGYYEGKVFDYHQSGKLVNADSEVGIALSGEWVRYTVTTADLTRVMPQ